MGSGNFWKTRASIPIIDAFPVLHFLSSAFCSNENAGQEHVFIAIGPLEREIQQVGQSENALLGAGQGGTPALLAQN
jgi:hypothetical protein